MSVSDTNESRMSDFDVVTARKPKKGIIFLSSIPKYMNVTKLREIMGNYGDVGKIFLQPAANPHVKKRPAVHFTEGWVEFERKKVAKQVANLLNGNRIDCRKRSKFFDGVWNIKYLPRFKWVHLNERLAYEKAVLKHRLRAEISQVKRQANHFSSNILQSENQMLSRPSNVNINVQQRLPEEEYAAPIEDLDRTEFLSSLFL